MQSQKSPKPAVDSIIPYFSHPCLLMSGHDFFRFFFDFLYIFEGRHFQNGRHIRKPEVACKPSHFCLHVCQIWSRSVERSFREPAETITYRRRRRRKIIIITRFKVVLGMPNTKCLPNELPLPLSSLVGQKTPKYQFSLQSEDIDIFPAIFSRWPPSSEILLLHVCWLIAVYTHTKFVKIHRAVSEISQCPRL